MLCAHTVPLHVGAASSLDLSIFAASLKEGGRRRRREAGGRALPGLLPPSTASQHLSIFFSLSLL